MIGYSKRRAFVIPNGFDGDVFWPDRKTRVEMRAALGVEPSDLVLGHVARFHPVKNQLALVRCFSMVAKIRPRIRLLLAGDGLGEENVALEKEISQSGLARERFLLLGRRGDIPQVLTAVDGFVLPSLSEAFPNSLVEAMCSGLVSIASDVGEARKILGATDFLIPPQDNWALCDAIERWADLDESTRKKQGASARESVLARYSTSQFGKNYSEMYQAIATRAAHSFGGAY
jgi:glycosyltransferase involved in cell wall biosynthesis